MSTQKHHRGPAHTLRECVALTTSHGTVELAERTEAVREFDAARRKLIEAAAVACDRLEFAHADELRAAMLDMFGIDAA